MQQILSACKESGIAYASRQLGLTAYAIKKRLRAAGIDSHLFDGRKKSPAMRTTVAKLEQEVQLLAKAVVAMQAAMEKQKCYVEIVEIHTVSKAIVLANQKMKE